MAVDLVLLLPALVEQRQLEQRPHIGPLARQGDEQRHVRRRVVHALPVRVEVDRPLISTHRKGVRRDVLANPHALGQRITSDLELVRTIHRLRQGGGGSLGRWLRGQREGRRRGGGPRGGAALANPTGAHWKAEKKKLDRIWVGLVEGSSTRIDFWGRIKELGVGTDDNDDDLSVRVLGRLGDF